MTIPVLRNYINGEFVPAHGTGNLPVVSPVTELQIATSPVSDTVDVDAAFVAAEAAATTWNRTTPSERQEALLALAAAVEAHADELVEAQYRNTGQPKVAIREEEVAAGANHLRFFAGAARTMEGRAAGEYLTGHTSFIRREPIGVVAQVTPWNYPLMMAVWKIGPALAAGNTIVLKPSDTTPESTLALARLAGEVLPPGVLNVVLGDASTGELMSHHRVPGLVAVTGSQRAGRAVAAASATTLHRTHLELGGKAPAVVFEDVDVTSVATALAGFGYFNAGQDCTAVTRILVHSSIHDELVQKLTAAAKATRVGEHDEAYYGPLNNAQHLAKVEKTLADLPSHATIETGGRRLAGQGYYFAPTVISGVQQDDDIVQREVFGPVLTVQPFETEEEAVTLANGVEYGLAGSVWTRDHARAMRVSRDLECGCVWINTHIVLTAEMPHGGFKGSGYGKDMSVYSVEEYTRVKHVVTALDY